MNHGFFIFVLLAIYVLVAIIVAIHAGDRGRTKLWGLVVFVGGIFGLVIYLMVILTSSAKQADADVEASDDDHTAG